MEPSSTCTTYLRHVCHIPIGPHDHCVETRILQRRLPAHLDVQGTSCVRTAGRVRVEWPEFDVVYEAGHLAHRLCGEQGASIGGIGVRIIGPDEGRGHAVRGVGTQVGDVNGGFVGLANVVTGNDYTNVQNI